MRIKPFRPLTGARDVSRIWLRALSLSCLIMAAVLMVGWTIWRLPETMVNSYGNTSYKEPILTRLEYTKAVDDYRKTIAQMWGGLFLIASIYVAWKNYSNARLGQITDRFIRAIEQTGAVDGSGQPNLEVRIGGLHALERIARESNDDRVAICAILSAYVRQNSPAPAVNDTTAERRRTAVLRSDVQTAIGILGRIAVIFSSYEQERLNLSGTDLRGASLYRARLSGATLVGARLDYVTTEAFTHLTGADLSHADLRGANLRHTILWKTSLREALLDGANLNKASLEGADLTDAVGLKQTQIDLAEGDGTTKLPSYISRPSHWPERAQLYTFKGGVEVPVDLD